MNAFGCALRLLYAVAIYSTLDKTRQRRRYEERAGATIQYPVKF